MLDTGAAENGDYELGDEVQLLAPYGEIEQTATLVGTAEFNGGGTAGATLLIFSTEGAQRLFLDGHDVFNRVSLTAADGVSQEELADAAEKVIPDDFEAVTGDKVADESQAAIGEFLGVIKIFLLIFAGIAVLVGGFIILNTFSILVAQRSRELALMRALGAAREQVTRSVLLEALVLSFVASTIGIALGWLLARGLAALFRAIGLDIAGNALDLTATGGDRQLRRRRRRHDDRGLPARRVAPAGSPRSRRCGPSRRTHPRRSAAAPPSVARSSSSAPCSRPGAWWGRRGPTRSGSASAR